MSLPSPQLTTMIQSGVRRLALFAWGCWMLTWVPAVATAQSTPEYLIKAAYLYNFALFVEWPADAFATSNAPIVIGVVGEDPFDSALDRTIRGKKISKRPLVVRRLRWSEDLRQCHILFVSAAEASKASELARLDGLPVLVVGETPGFARRGGTINFVIQDNKVRFEVNVDAAKRARLNISATLLNLARIVRSS